MTELTPEEEQFVADWLARLSDFCERKTEDCPHCGKHVTRAEQIRRCVYLRPCGCRLWQGDIPNMWKGNPK